MTPLPPHRARLQNAFASNLPPGSRLAVTGASGWLGTVLTNMALRTGLSAERGNLRLFGSQARELRVAGGSLLKVENLNSAEPLRGGGWIVAHFAALGKERTRDLTPLEFAQASDEILTQTMRLVEGATQPRVIFSSSGAARAAEAPGASNPYGLVKRIQEVELTDRCSALHIPLVIARIFNVGGPYGNKLDLYALSSVLRDAASGGPIVLRAQSSVYRSYVHVEELIAVLLAAVGQAAPEQSVRFDTCGTETVELGELAQMACRLFARSQADIVRHHDPALDEDRYVGRLPGYAAAVKSAGVITVPLGTILRDTIKDLGLAYQENLLSQRVDIEPDSLSGVDEL